MPTGILDIDYRESNTLRVTFQSNSGTNVSGAFSGTRGEEIKDKILFQQKNEKKKK